MQPSIQIKQNHLAIHVKSLHHSVAFYSQVLGLKQVEEPFKDGLHAWFEVGGGVTIHLIEELNQLPPLEKSKTNHLCFTVSDLVQFIRTLQEAGFEFENWAGNKGEIHVRPDGIQQVFFTDPDGYWLEVNDDWKE